MTSTAIPESLGAVSQGATIVFHFNTEAPVPLYVIDQVLHQTDLAIRHRQEEVLLSPEIEAFYPPLVRDAAVYRLRRAFGSGLCLKSSQSHSLQITGAAVGIGSWVLAHTIGESGRQGWAESSAHKQLSDWVTGRIEACINDVQRLKQDVSKSLARLKLGISLRDHAEQHELLILVPQNVLKQLPPAPVAGTPLTLG